MVVCMMSRAACGGAARLSLRMFRIALARSFWQLRSADLMEPRSVPKRTIPPYQTLFDDDDYQLKHFHNGPDLLITFTPRYGRDAEDRTGFGAGVFDQRGFSMLCVIGKWDHWWQPSGIEQILSISNSLIARRGYSSVCTYGISMGAYGAGLLADRFGASRAIMVAPQFTPDPGKPPYELRWRAEAHRIKFERDNMDEALKGPATRLIIFDPWHRPDRAHADLFLQRQGCRAISVPFSGHAPADVLKETRLLRRTITELIDGTFDHAGYRRALRSARGSSPSYLAMMADKICRRWPDAAISLLDRAITLDPKRSTYISRMIGVLIRIKRYEAALSTAETAVVAFPHQYSIWKSLSEAALHLGQFDKALQAARRSTETRPNNVDIALNLVKTLVESGKGYEAQTVADRIKDLMRPLPHQIARLDSMMA
ncbi:hypothetical protein PY32053_01631 [Paracoccus yeei]|uniref:Uncharacterized protein n=1 Tax=Paracoccus yeei TaxID=147645 RepID=A0A386ULT5_9RHOB|nr:tetratricopeptide repeat protein [Paracoccus yeei]AYF01258.1 hypothetical protein PY32053_01631 [Paracoccus yeei]